MTQRNLLSLGLPRRHLGVALALAAFAPACGDDGAGSGGTGGAGTTTVASTVSSTGSTSTSGSAATSGSTSSGATSTGTGAMLDLANGTWAIDRISDLPGTVTAWDPSIAFTTDDRLFAAYSANDVVPDSPSTVRVAQHGADWSDVLLVSDSVLRDPELRAVGASVWFAWTSVDSMDPENPSRSNLSLAIAHDGAFSPAIDVTSAFHPTGYTSEPVIVPLSAGGAAVVYMFWQGTSASSRIETVFLDSQGNPLGDPVVALGGAECFAPSATRMPDDKVVVVALCDTGSKWYAAMAIGAFDTPFVEQTVPEPIREIYGVKVAADSQSRIHLAWDTVCPGGVQQCRRVQTASGTPGAWGQILELEGNSYLDQIEVDPWYRPVILSTVWDGTQGDITLRYAPDGTTYAPPILVTSGSPQLNDTTPGSVSFRASDGGPELTFLRSTPDAQGPVDANGFDVYRARFVPN